MSGISHSFTKNIPRNRTSPLNLLHSTYFLPLLVFLIGFLGKLPFITAHDISVDEPFSIFHAQLPPATIAEILLQGNNPPLFEIFLHYWMLLFGDSPVAVRLPSLLFSALTGLMLFLTGRRLLNAQSGLLAALLFSFSFPTYFFGMEARVYALLSFLSSSALYISLRMNEPGHRIWPWLVLVNSLLLYSHYLGGFILLNQLILVPFLFPNRKVLLRFLAVMGLTLLFYLPLLPVLMRQFLANANHGTWVVPPAPEHFAGFLRSFFNHGDLFQFTLRLLLAGTVLALFRVRMGYESLQAYFKKEHLLLFLWGMLPFSLMFFISDKIPMFIERYVYFNAVGLFAFTGVFLMKLGKRYSTLTFLLGLGILGHQLFHLRIAPRDFFYRDIRLASQEVKKHYDSNSLVILHPFWSDLGFLYYFDRDIFRDPFHKDKRMQESGLFPVYAPDNVEGTLKAHPEKKKLIYFQESSTFVDPTNAVYHYLDSLFPATDSAFFHEGYRVTVFRIDRSMRNDHEGDRP